MADVVADLIARIQARLGHQQVRELAEIERQVRLEWGGQYTYVAGRKMARDESVRQALAMGTSASDLARHIGLSERQIRRIAQR